MTYIEGCKVSLELIRRIAVGWGETETGCTMRSLLEELDGGAQANLERLRTQSWIYRTKAGDSSGDIIWALHDECVRRRAAEGAPEEEH